MSASRCECGRAFIEPCDHCGEVEQLARDAQAMAYASFDATLHCPTGKFHKLREEWLARAERLFGKG